MTIANMHSEFRILLDKGDSFDAPDFLPEEIESQILNVRKCIVNYNLLRKQNYLSHLPLQVDIYFVEIDMSLLLRKE